MTIRDIAISFGFEINEATERAANNAVESLKTAATNALEALNVGYELDEDSEKDVLDSVSHIQEDAEKLAETRVGYDLDENSEKAAADSMDGLKKAAEPLEKNTVGYEVDKKSENQAMSSIKQIRAFAIKSLGVIGIGFSLLRMRALAEEFNDVNSVIQDATRGMGDQRDIQQKILKVANETRMSYGAMADNVAKLARNTEVFESVESAANFAGLMAKEFKAAGKNNAQVQTLMQSITTSMSRGKVDSRAMMALFRESPGTLRMMADSLGVTTDTLQDMVSQGQVSATTLRQVFEQNADGINSRFGELDYSIGDAVLNIRNQWGHWLDEINSALGITRNLAKFMVKAFNQIMRVLRRLQDTFMRLADRVGGVERLMRLLAIAGGAIFLALNAGKILSFIKAAGAGIGRIKLKTLALVAVFIIIALLIDDLINFMKGNDSLIGEMFDKFGIDGDEVRETIRGVIDALKGLLPLILGLAKQLAGLLLGALKQLLPLVIDLIKQILPVVINFVTQLISLLAETGKRIIPLLVGVIERLIPLLIGILQAVLPVIIGLIEKLLPFLFLIIEEILDVVIELIDMLIPLLFEIIEAVLPIIITLIETLLPLVFQVITTILPVLMSLIRSLLPLVMQIIRTIMPVIIRLIETLVPIIVQIIERILPFLLNLIKRLVPFLIQIIEAILPVVINLIEALLPLVFQIIETVLPVIISLIDILLPLVFQIIDIILPIIIRLIETLLPIVFQIIDAVLPVVISLIELLISVVLPIVDLILPLLMTLLEALMPVITFVAELLGNVLGAAFEGLMPIINAVMGIFQGLIDFITGVFTGDWSKAWEGIKQIFSAIMETIGAIFKFPINLIITGLNTFIGGLNKLKIPDWVPVVGGKGINIPLIPKLEKGSDNTPDTFIAGDVNGKGGELVTGAKGRKVFTAAETGNIFQTLKDIAMLGMTPRPETLAAAASSIENKSIIQNVEINNKFEGDRAGQQKSAEAMDKAADDATGILARGLAYAR